MPYLHREIKSWRMFFFRPLDGVFDEYTLSDDGTRVIMPVGSDEVIIDQIN